MIPSLRRCDGNPCKDVVECLMFGNLLSTTSVGKSDVRQTDNAPTSYNLELSRLLILFSSSHHARNLAPGLAPDLSICIAESRS